VDPYWGQLFVSLFNLTRQRLAGKGFTLWWDFLFFSVWCTVMGTTVTRKRHLCALVWDSFRVDPYWGQLFCLSLQLHTREAGW
jgi:hypothetical protein